MTLAFLSTHTSLQSHLQSVTSHRIAAHCICFCFSTVLCKLFRQLCMKIPRDKIVNQLVWNQQALDHLFLLFWCFDVNNIWPLSARFYTIHCSCAWNSRCTDVSIHSHILPGNLILQVNRLSIPATESV